MAKTPQRKTLIAVRLDAAIVEALAQYRAVERVSATDQIDLALRAFFKAKGHPIGGSTRKSRKAR
jgi:hypothetical protein